MTTEGSIFAEPIGVTDTVISERGLSDVSEIL